MTTFLLPECLENIFSHLLDESFSSTSTGKYKDLHSCTLVSRHWCRISTPFLYAYPHSFYHPTSYFKLIRTLLSCVPQSEIRRIYKVLSANHIPLNKKDSYSNISSTFNYVSFIRGFIFDETILKSRNVCYYKSIWLSAHDPEKLSSEQIIRIMEHLVEFMCKHFNNLTMLELPHIMSNNYIFRLSQLISLISLQRSLQHIILSRWDWGYVTIDLSILDMLSTQSESLQILELKNLSFDQIDEKALNLLCSLKNIRGLKLYYCNGISNLNSWAKCLTKLKTLEINFSDGISIDFLLHLFQSSSNTLTKLEINRHGCQNITQLLQQIPFYLRSLNHLVLYSRIFQTELISILKSCTKLVYLDVILDDDESLKGLGKFIPETLERIKFRLLGRIEFKKSLRCFLEEYINNIDDDDNNGALKYLEFNEVWENWSDYYLELNEKFGIQITDN